MQAKERLYSTTDGRIVRENDPAGAYLAYGIGDEIKDKHVAEVNDLTDRDATGSAAAYHDDDVRDEMRVMQARPDTDRNAPRPFLHDRLATELADEARERANRDEPLSDSDDAVSSKRLYWRARKDGNGPDVDGDLLAEGDPDAAFLAYAPGDVVNPDHLDAFESVDEPPDNGSRDEKVADPVTPVVPVPPRKATPAKAPAPANS